jgi:putative ABC transport system permease protein
VVSVLNRKLMRELRSNGGVLLAISSIMAIGVAAYVALHSAYDNLESAQRRYYAQCRMADFSIDLKKVPNADLAAVALLPGVVEIRPRIQFFATVDLEQVIEPLNGLVLSLPDRRAPVINDILLRQGSYFTDRRSNEVIVNESFARHHNLYPGQWIHLLLNDRRQELFIVGTAISSEFTYLVGPGTIVPDARRFGVFYLKQTYAEEVFNFDGASNQVVGLLAPDVRDHPQEVLRRAELLLDPYGVLTTTPRKDQPSHRFLSNEIQGLRAFGVINPAIFLAVAALVLNVLISRIAEQQRVVVGTLKAVGYDDRQVFGHFIKFGLAVGLAGGLAGCALGYWIAAGMTGLYQSFFQFPSLKTQLYAGICAEGVAIGLVCGLLGSVHGARAMLRLEPAEAMRPKPPAQGGAIALERVSWLWSRLSFAWRSTLRSLVRNRVRTASGMFASAMGAMVCVNALMLHAATRHMIDFQFELVQRSDVDLAFKDERGRDALSEIQGLTGVDYAEPVLDVACTFTNGPYSHKGGISGLMPNARLTVPRDADGRRLRIPAAGLAMTRKMADLLNVRRGDLVSVQPSKGLREVRAVRVEEIVDSYLGIAVYAEIDFLSRLVHEELAVTGVQLTGPQTPKALPALYRELKQMPGLRAVSSRADMIANVMDSLVKNQRVFIGLLVMFAGVIFFGSVLNASLISLAERRREVATLQVLGYSEWQIGGLFLRESMLTNMAGTVVGLPLGYLLNYGITLAYDTEMFRIPLVDPRQIWAGTLLLGVVFGLLAHLILQRSLARMDWLEALQTKE